MIESSRNDTFETSFLEITKSHVSIQLPQPLNDSKPIFTKPMSLLEMAQASKGKPIGKPTFSGLSFKSKKPMNAMPLVMDLNKRQTQSSLDTFRAPTTVSSSSAQDLARDAKPIRLDSGIAILLSSDSDIILSSTYIMPYCSLFTKTIGNNAFEFNTPSPDEQIKDERFRKATGSNQLFN